MDSREWNYLHLPRGRVIYDAYIYNMDVILACEGVINILLHAWEDVCVEI